MMWYALEERDALVLVTPTHPLPPRSLTRGPMAKTDCVVTLEPEQVAASRTFSRADANARPLRATPPGTDLPLLGPVGQFVDSVIVYLLFLGLSGLCLPRPPFTVFFKIAFPFMPVRLDKDGD
jgi:hypothetical protein